MAQYLAFELKINKKEGIFDILLNDGEEGSAIDGIIDAIRKSGGQITSSIIEEVDTRLFDDKTLQDLVNKNSQSLDA